MIMVIMVCRSLSRMGVLTAWPMPCTIAAKQPAAAAATAVLCLNELPVAVWTDIVSASSGTEPPSAPYRPSLNDALYLSKRQN